jgi:hypothetical protein
MGECRAGSDMGTGTGAWKFDYGAGARERRERRLMGLCLIDLLEENWLLLYRRGFQWDGAERSVRFCQFGFDATKERSHTNDDKKTPRAADNGKT